MANVINTNGARKFFVEMEDDMVFVATDSMLGSNIAAQLVCHEAMKPTGLKFAKVWRNVETPDGWLLLGVGYRFRLIDKILRRNNESYVTRKLATYSARA